MVYDSPIKTAYITNLRLPSERAHGHQVAQVCDALVKNGHEVTILAPFRQNVISEDYWQYYGADKRVKLEHLRQFDPIDRWWIPRVLQLPILNNLLRKGVKNHIHHAQFDVLYTRSPALLPTLLEIGIPVILELHRLPSRGRARFVEQCNRCTTVVCLTSPMREELRQRGVKNELMIVEGDAVQLEPFAQSVDPVAVRQSHHLPVDVPLIGFAGQLKTMGLSKGVEVLLAALEMLAQRGERFHAVIAGGPESERQALASSLSPTAVQHVTFTGQLPHQSIPALLQSCDVLVYPAPASDHPFYQRDTSPLKIFEYLAAGVPIVSADLPPIRDVLDSSVASLVPPGDSTALAETIADILKHPDTAKKRAEKGKEMVKRWTWEERMKRILQRD